MNLEKPPFAVVVLVVAWGGFWSGVFLVLGFLRLIPIRALNKVFARALWWLASRLFNLRLEVSDPHGYLALPGAKILVANHQSNWDAFVFGGIFPEGAYIVGKRELNWIPIFGWFFKFANNFYIDRSNRMRASRCMDEVARRLREKGDSIWMFPEGTRNTTERGGLLAFKQGAFRTALSTGAAVLPLVAEPGYLKKNIVRIKILKPILATEQGITDASNLSNYVRTQMLEALQSFPAQ